MTREEKQKAIDALKISAPIMAVTQEEFKDYIQTLNKIMDWLEQESRWIPVSERLPQEAFGCLVTVIDTDVHTQEEFENVLPYFVGYDGETWNDSDGEVIPFEVIAWMPLPKAYREVEDE